MAGASCSKGKEESWGVQIKGGMGDRALQGVEWVQRVGGEAQPGGGFAGLGMHPSNFALPWGTTQHLGPQASGIPDWQATCSVVCLCSQQRALAFHRCSGFGLQWEVWPEWAPCSWGACLGVLSSRRHTRGLPPGSLTCHLTPPAPELYLGDSAENCPWRPERCSNLPEVTQQILLLSWDFCPEPAPGKMMGLSRERWDSGQESFQSTEATLTYIHIHS